MTTARGLLAALALAASIGCIDPRRCPDYEVCPDPPSCPEAPACPVPPSCEVEECEPVSCAPESELPNAVCVQPLLMVTGRGPEFRLDLSFRRPSSGWVNAPTMTEGGVRAAELGMAQLDDEWSFLQRGKWSRRLKEMGGWERSQEGRARQIHRWADRTPAPGRTEMSVRACMMLPADWWTAGVPDGEE